MNSGRSVVRAMQPEVEKVYISGYHYMNVSCCNTMI